MRSQIKIGALISYISIIFNIVSGLIYTPWMIGKIGQGNFGLYTLALSFIGFFVVDFGLSNAVTRFVSKYNAEGNKEKVSDFLGLTYKIYMFIAAIFFLLLFVLYFFIDILYKNLSTEELETFRILYIIVGFYVVVQFPFISLNGILTAYEKFIPLKFCDLLKKLFIVILMVFLLLKGYGVFALVTVNAGVNLFIILLKLIIIKKQTDCSVNFKYSDKSLFKEIFSFSIWITVSKISQRLIFNITPTIIAAVSTTGAIGCAIFGLTTTIESYINLFANAINNMFLPRITQIIHNPNSSIELNKLFIKIGRIQLFINSFIILFFISFGKTFIVYIWHRPEFVESYLCTVFVIIPAFFYIPFELVILLMEALNKADLQAKINIWMAVINVALSLVLSKYYGPLGASIAIFFAFMFRTVMIGYVTHKKLNVDMIYFVKETFVKNILSYIIILAIGLLLENYMPIKNNILKFLVNGLIFSLVYIFILFKFIMNDVEKEKYLKPILKLRKKY